MNLNWLRLGILGTACALLCACGQAKLQADADHKKTLTQKELLSNQMAAAEKASTPAAKVNSSKKATSSAVEKPRVPLVQRPGRDGKLFKLISQILEQSHYVQHPYDAEISQKQLKGYIESLDFNHLIFLQSDVDEFNAKYGAELPTAAAQADAGPAFEIFERFCQRLDQSEKLIGKLLKEKYDFTIEERFTPNREKAAFPKDEAEAEVLWRKRIKLELLQGRLAKEKPEDTVKKIAKRYHNLVRQVNEYENEDVMQAFLNGMCHSYDPHTDYFTPDEAENFDINAIKLSLSGIGAVLKTEDGYAKIERLVPGGPADLDRRLKPNDRICAVAQGESESVDVVNMKLSKVVDLIRGKRGTKVRLSVLQAGAPETSAPVEIVLKRDEIKLTEQFAKARIYERRMPNGEIRRVGVITLPQFYQKTVSDIVKLIERLKTENTVGLILDMRRNGGGLLDQAIDLTGLFIKGGPVVQVKDAQGRTQVLRTNSRQPIYDGPLITMAGHLSASAAEIVAGALQDYGRSLVVGDKSTHGKGTVQVLEPLERWMGLGWNSGDPGKLKITVSKFYRVAGGSTQQKGVIPDISLPSVLDYYEIGERFLTNCLPYDEVSPATYQPMNMVTPYLPELIASSNARVNKSRDFVYVKEDIEFLKKRLADKSVSLNETVRLKEKNDLQALTDARKTERSKRSPESQDKIYELTIDMIDKKAPLAEFKPPKITLASTSTNSNSEEDPNLSDDNKDADGIDPQLQEAISIMCDYATMLSGKGHVAANP